ncbi:iron-sulfur cluster co-chaperone protein HscB homolog isoform X2 [Phoenix dactylifera]|uniref:Iron-sulfur cluster co-chaperone protein HscB homolog isoform X2 n=1 Tax=Phoenix dactylifera TaxID=42345 RepID=A0A8B8J3J7_PHODC|nr:iron-sulfur cluster co-chaperone protein HscB homolog isoform X2 [Phoenix dactylifera]
MAGAGTVELRQPWLSHSSLAGHVEVCNQLTNLWTISRFLGWKRDMIYRMAILKKEKTFAADQSARVNDAYRTLNKSLSRALYLMRLEGVHVDEEKTVMDPDLLAEMMDIREAVEEASDSHALKQLQTQIERKFEAWANSFREAFKRKNFDDAINSIQRMRYYDRAIEEIIKKL